MSVKFFGARSGALLALLFAAHAHASHVVYSPIVEHGEKEVELMADHVIDSSSPADGDTTWYVEAAWGVAPRWMTELLVEIEDPHNDSSEVEAIEWENVFQLSEQGQYWLDYGLFFELEKALEDGNPDEVVGGLLLQKDFAKITAIVNLLAEKEFGDNAESEIEGLFSGQLRWRLQPTLEPTLEVYSNEYNSRLGTLINGKFKASSAGKFGYSLGVLWGLDDDTPDTLRAMIEYEF